MKRLIALCALYPLLSMSGPYMATQRKAILIEAFLYHNNTLISEDAETYYPNKNGTYRRATIPYEHVKSNDSITINNVDFDPKNKLPKIVYCLRLCQGDTITTNSYPVFLTFNDSVTHSLDNGMQVQITLSKIKANDTASMNSLENTKTID